MRNSKKGDFGKGSAGFYSGRAKSRHRRWRSWFMLTDEGTEQIAKPDLFVFPYKDVSREICDLGTAARKN